MVLSVGGVCSTAALGTQRAHAEETTRLTGVHAEEEAWFYRFRRPTDLAGDPDDPGTGHVDFLKTNSEVTPPYDTGTLRVGLVNGQPEARIFLSLPSLFEFGAAAQVAGGHVRFPLHDADESLREPESADMVACLVTDVVVGEEGARWSDQPKFDCKIQAPLELDKGSDPMTWTLDLSVFATAWQNGAAPQGFVILENPEPAEDDGSWHVAFRSVNHLDGPSVTYDLVLRGVSPVVGGIPGAGGEALGGFTGAVPNAPLFPIAPTGDREADGGPSITPPIGAVPRGGTIPLARSTQLLVAVVIALVGGAALRRAVGQDARSVVLGAAGSLEAMAES